MTTEIPIVETIDLSDLLIISGETDEFIRKFNTQQQRLQGWSTGLSPMAQAINAVALEVSTSAQSVSDNTQLSLTAKDQAVAARNETLLLTDQAVAAAETATQVESAVTAAVQFVGRWDDATGAAQAGYTYSHNKNVWLLTQDVTEIQAHEPVSSSDYWVRTGGGGGLSPVLVRELPGQRFFQVSASAAIASISTIQAVQVFGVLFEAGATIATGSVAAGNDYSLLFNKEAQVFSVASDFNPTDPMCLIGGFHVYTNGDIAENSVWDRGFRPSAPDPRGMVLDPLKKKWVDIYLLGQNHIADGTSRANVSIASGSRLPKKPLIYGGDGAASYPRLSYFEARNILASHGKRLPDLQLFASAANGSTPKVSIGADPVTTKYAAGYRSQIGIEQATGHLLVWTEAHSVKIGTNTWQDVSAGDGSWVGESFYTALAGGLWSNSGYAGPACVSWVNSPASSNYFFGVRGVCDHEVL